MSAVLVERMFLVVLGANDKVEEKCWSIPRNNLEDFIHVCLFNGYYNIMIQDEESAKKESKA